MAPSISISQIPPVAKSVIISPPICYPVRKTPLTFWSISSEGRRLSLYLTSVYWAEWSTKGRTPDPDSAMLALHLTEHSPWDWHMISARIIKILVYDPQSGSVCGAMIWAQTHRTKTWTWKLSSMIKLTGRNIS